MLIVSGCILEASKEAGFCDQDAGVGWRQPLQKAAGGKQPTGTRRNLEVGSRLFSQISQEQEGPCEYLAWVAQLQDQLGYLSHIRFWGSPTALAPGLS